MVRTNQKATDKNEMELRVIIKDRRVMEIINSIDFGFKRKFVESAILHFAQNQPSIKLHFDGITKPNKRGRKPKDNYNNSEGNGSNGGGIDMGNNVTLKNNSSVVKSESQTKEIVSNTGVTKTSAEESQSQMMFNF